MSKTAEELIEIIKQNNLKKALFCFEEVEDHIYTEYTPEEYFDNIGLGKVEIIEHVCNSDEMYIIIYFADQNIHLRINGEYDSYGGGDHYYDGTIREVKPKTVQKIIYENI